MDASRNGIVSQHMPVSSSSGRSKFSEIGVGGLVAVNVHGPLEVEFGEKCDNRSCFVTGAGAEE